MTSHEYARKAQELAKWLLDRPEFNTDYRSIHMFVELQNREQVVAAVQATKPGRKEFDSNSFEFYPEVPEDIYLRIRCPRDKVCTLVSPAKYDCEPILTEMEAEAL